MSSPIIIIDAPRHSKPDVNRPVANFHPDVWGDRFLEYSPLDEEVVRNRKVEHESLKSKVRKELLDTSNESDLLQVIDTIERLGVAYHFEKESEEFLRQIYDTYKQNPNLGNKLSFYDTCLKFRILRQHGYYITSDIFTTFTDELGDFLESFKSDAEGLLSLYDAAHLRGHGENILEKAIEFTTHHLKAIAAQKEHPLAARIARTLIYPIHRGVVQIETRHFISYYAQDPTHNATLLRLSKLEFDLMQSLHKEELQELIKWWRSFDFAGAFPFVRDRVVEAFLFSVGVFYDPKFSVARIIYTKAFMVLTILDDIYDSYGTIEELELFTQAIDRWDKGCLDIKLPTYIKLFCEIQRNTYKQFEYDLTKLGRKNYVHYAVKEIITLSKAYIREAKWRERKHIPTFDEYYNNAIRSSACTLTSLVSLLDNKVEESVAKKTFECVSAICKPQRSVCTIGRFMNDLADSKWDKHRDHVASGVDCYIKEYGVSEEETFVALSVLIEDAWKDINEEMFQPTTPIPRVLLAYILNSCRVIDYVYKNEDGFTIVSQRMKDTIKLLFIEHVAL